MDLSRLPRPDAFGCYWFGPPGCGDTPAIFPFSGGDRSGRVILSLGKRGVVFDGPDLRAFGGPGEALTELRRRLSQGR